MFGLEFLKGFLHLNVFWLAKMGRLYYIYPSNTVECERSPASMKCESLFFVLPIIFILQASMLCTKCIFFHIPRTFSVNNFIIGPYLPNCTTIWSKCIDNLLFAVIQHLLVLLQKNNNTHLHLSTTLVLQSVLFLFLSFWKKISYRTVVDITDTLTKHQM